LHKVEEISESLWLVEVELRLIYPKPDEEI
jgi:hypothetical protein